MFHGLVLVLVVVTCGWIILKAALGIPIVLHLPDVYEVGKGVAIFDRNDKHLSTVYADRDSIPVPLAKVSPFMRTALVAAEDHRFYEHHGMDLVGISRAIFSNVKAGHLREGGSTITQQLARNLYLNIQDRSLTRKLVEAGLSIDIELNNPKDKIMETYLNDIYFGRSVYGIERAAGAYFNKHASALTMPEAAFLAGVIREPSALGNIKNLNRALERQHQVLDAMVEDGNITAPQAEKAKKVKLSLRQGAPPAQPFPYYISYVVQLLKESYSDKQIWATGLRVYTNLDSQAQQAAQKFLTKGINTAPSGINQGALVSISVKDGAVIALVGGVGEYRSHQWNRAVYPHTAGSAFKPFVYLAGIANGVLKPNTMLDDSALTIDQGFGQSYSPRNFDGKFLGDICVRQALSLSRNVCAIRVAQAVGIAKVIEIARLAGVSVPLENNLTVALGSGAVSPLELANAYAMFARAGVFMPAQFIRRIDNSQGGKLAEFPLEKRTVLPPEPVLELVDIMQDVVQHGTGTQAKLQNIAVAGKTGTADKARDIWFVGFTPDTVTAVWGGNDNNRAVRGNVSGGTVMAKIWHDYMSDFYKSHKPEAIAFSAPATPFATSATAINPSVLNDIQQYEEGVKTDPAQMQGASEQPQPADPEQQEEDQSGNNEQMPPLAPPINRTENDGRLDDRQERQDGGNGQDVGQPVDQKPAAGNDQLSNDQKPAEGNIQLRPELRQPDSRQSEPLHEEIQAPPAGAKREGWSPAPAPTPAPTPAPALAPAQTPSHSNSGGEF